MAARHLSTVRPVQFGMAADIHDLPLTNETTAQRIRRLQDEARILAREQVEQLVRDLDALAARARDIAEGGEAYAVGAREMASRLAEDLPYRARGLSAITGRTAA